MHRAAVVQRLPDEGAELAGQSLVRLAARLGVRLAFQQFVGQVVQPQHVGERVEGLPVISEDGK